MVLESTQPLTEMSSRNIFFVFKEAVRGADNHIVPQHPGALRPYAGLYIVLLYVV